MTALLPCMQWLVAPTPRRLPVAITSTPVTPSCQVTRRPGVVTNSQATCGEVVDPDGYGSDVFVGLAVRAHAKRGHVKIHSVDTLLAEQRVCLDAGRCDH